MLRRPVGTSGSRVLEGVAFELLESVCARPVYLNIFLLDQILFELVRLYIPKYVEVALKGCNHGVH